MNIANTSRLTDDEIKALVPLGTFRNYWRQRVVAVYEHPTDPLCVVTIGTSFDGRSMTICAEGKDSYRRQLNGDWSDYN